ncbi:hypothetical protein DZF91_01540 [Actinomadura logoneensis]|uniref:Uncharacterized protein n=1 Tax=Actinomadura logoneensis TaxID=2293572 RepID=A0A372JTL7_9ACTN|nr:hypothetical protein [Actinomadura logoneensis]RFU43347.1 hypothetical protein DZF91_01540 [Actinomadura logoneensis]
MLSTRRLGVASTSFALAVSMGLASATSAEAAVPYRNWVQNYHNWIGVKFHPDHYYWTAWEIWRNAPGNNFLIQWRLKGTKTYHTVQIPARKGHYWVTQRIPTKKTIYFRIYDWDFPSQWVAYHT